MKVVTMGKENARFQILNSLKTNREKRNREGFLIEGVRNVAHAIKYKWEIVAFFYSSQKGISSWARDILRDSKADTHYDLSTDLLTKLSSKDEPSELLALAKIPDDDLDKIPTHEKLLVVVFDRPSSPGNLGTIIRSCDALGADGLVVTGHATDVYDPETVSATTGSLFSLPVVRVPSHNELMPWVEQLRETYPDLQIVGTDEKGDRTIFQCDFTKPTIILAGNEKSGLSRAYQEMATRMVKIPMRGSASSLNVAVATSIVLAEIGRQRSGAGLKVL